MYAHIAINQLGNVHVNGYAAQHIGICLRQMLFVHQVLNHLPHGDVRSGVEVAVAAHGDDVRSGLRPWPSQRLVFVHNELELAFERCFDGSDVYLAVALRGMPVTNFKQRTFNKHWDI